MKVGGVYSFKGGSEAVAESHSGELRQVLDVISSVDASQFKTKSSLEKTMPGQLLYHPQSLNRAYSDRFTELGWHTHRVYCDYPTEYYTADYIPRPNMKGAFREMDFVKNRLGVEVQFGKYAFMVYNVCAKMTIFRNQGVIDMGIEIVPLKELALEMSSGVSYFEQFVWDLEHRGVSDIDIPVLILGVIP
jgi:hypothetical protein